MRESADWKIDQLQKDLEEFGETVNRLSKTWDTALIKELKHRLASLEKKMAEIQKATKTRRS